MAVKIRLARLGAKKRPYFRVIVANNHAPRDGSFIEKVGYYNPMLPKDSQERVVLNSSRVEYWLSQGAQPTETVIRFIQQQKIQLPIAIQKKSDICFQSRTAKPKKQNKDK